MPALREILAQLDIEVRGLGSLRAADASVARYAHTLAPAVTESERLRVKQAELAEMASRLAQKMRALQKVEGDHSALLGDLRVTHQRLTAESKSYGAQADKLSGVTQTQTGGLGSLVKGWQGAVAAIGAAVAATAAVRAAFGAVTESIGEVIHQGDALNDMSVRVGISAGALQEWQFAAERSGVSADTLQRAIMTLGRNAAGAGAKGIEQLGIATEDASGSLRSREDLFADSIAALAGMSNATARAAMAQKLFGKSGGELLTLINEGPEGIALLRDRFHELGGGLSDGVVANAAAADDSLVDFRQATTSLRAALVADLLPAITNIVNAIAEMMGSLVAIVRTSSTVQAALVVLTTALTAAGIAGVFAFWEISVPLLIVAGLLGLLFIAVEDVITAFRGGESVFGSFVEYLLDAAGVSVTFAGAIDGIGLAWETMGVGAQVVLADMIRAIDTVKVALGLMDPAQAGREITGASIAANNASRQLQKSRSVVAAAEMSRRIERATPAPAEVLARKAPGGRVRSRGGGKMSVQAPLTINVNGGDPAATAREIARQHAQQIRAAADTIALAPDEED